MLRQKLQLKLQQKLSPQQIQMIKLLELPTLQLEQRVKKELEENPALEEGNEEDPFEEDVQEETDHSPEDEFTVDDYLDEDDVPQYRLNTRNYSKDDESKDIPYSEGISFNEHLEQQLRLKVLSERHKQLASYLLGNLDGDGYLRRDLESVAEDLAFSQNIYAEEEELEDALEVIQSLDPAGVGARDLKECLLLQLDRLENESESISNAQEILNKYFEAFTKKHYDKIIQRMKISEEALKDAFDVILKLNPRPGAAGNDNDKSIHTIIPDFIIDIKDGEIELSLTSKNAPELHVSRTYSSMLEDFQERKSQMSKTEKDAILFVKQKLDAAKWFIDAIKQRQNTLLITMQAIIDFQYSFFIEGDESKLKPMILKDIAEKTGLDISTISRVANSKYVQTPFGNYLLKYFFSEAMQKEDGESVSTREIKHRVKELIDNEDKKKPLTDDKLAQILKDDGYRIARRTVAKYREQLHIPVGRLRKEI